MLHGLVQGLAGVGDLALGTIDVAKAEFSVFDLDLDGVL